MLTRRRFLQSTALAGAALVVGFRLEGRPAAAAETVFAPNAFVRITPDNVVTIISKHIEMGQGSYTGLATILAEELDADWSQIRVEAAPVDLFGKYRNLSPDFKLVQVTGGSTSISNSWDQLREAGAKARAMLVKAAAREWGVSESEIVVDRGVVTHAGKGKRATFGALVSSAAGLSAPLRARPKDPAQYKLVGTNVRRLDGASKTDGSAIFTIDFRLPDTEMLTALILRPPRFGATVQSFDPTAALRVKGVTHVVEVPSGVAVVATGFWAAHKGREALREARSVRWDERRAETRSSDQLYADYRQLATGRGKSARRTGDAAGAIGKAAKVIEAVYEFPYLAHAPMEPLDAVARIGRDGCDVWTGSQAPMADHAAVVFAARMLPSRVRIHTLMAGGSFGRRATPNGEVAAEAAAVARAIKDARPVKVVWTREDDIRGGRYRPLYVHRLRAGLDAAGNIVGWEHHIVGQSIFKQSKLTAAKVVLNGGVDPSSVEGAADLPYAVPNVSVELHPTDDVRVPVLWWRSVGHTHTAFATETFLDECLVAAGRDPVKSRLALLAAKPRHHATLALAAAKAGWTEDKGWEPLPAGRARGIAVHESFSTVVAQIVEISRRPDGLPKVDRVVCAVDCGRAINPDIVRAQMEGGIGFGLGGALWSEITLVKGEPQQSNFDDYRPLRMEDMPPVEVHIVASDAAPTGVGEPGVPPIAPAVANAFSALTGQRVRRLPFARLVPAGTRTL